MKMLFLISIVLINLVAFGQQKDPVQLKQEKMQWFKDAKLGIFIHWGLYSVNGIDESWSFFNGYISHTDYLKQTNGFTAKNHNAQAWAELIKKSGAKYSVITSKHHDGFALWDSKFGDFNAAKHSKAKQDVLSPFVKALRDQGLKAGIYYSLPDWSYSDYTHFIRDSVRYTIAKQPKRWQKFLKVYQGKLKELSEAYNPDLYSCQMKTRVFVSFFFPLPSLKL